MANINPGALDGVRRIGAKVRELTVDGGITGAPLGFRLRGATASGAPQTGTWKAGDQVPDRTGIIWICTSGGTGLAATWTQSGLPVTATVPAFLAQPVPVVAHRGLPQVAPEETLTAFRSAVSAMLEQGYVPALKLDAIQLYDGTFGVMHDSTVTRTTTSTGNVTSYTAQTWQTLASPAGTLLGPAWANQSVPLLTDILDLLGGRCVLIIEPKSGTGSVAGILSLITARKLAPSCMLTAEDTTLTMPGLCKAAGVGFLYYFNANSVSSPVTAAQAAGTAGVTVLGIGVANAATGSGTAYTDANVTTVVSAATAAGIPSAGFTYIRRSDYTHAAGLGITIHQANDLYAVSAASPSGTSDLFSIGAPVPGEPGSNGVTATGTTQAPSYQYAGSTGNYRRAMTNSPVQSGIYECLGFLGPASGANGGTYTVGGTVFWDATETGSSDGGRFAGIVVGCPDDTAFSGNPTINGYNCLIRQGNGSTFSSPTFQIFKQVKGAYQNNGTYASGTSTQLSGGQLTNTTGYAAPNTLGAGISSGATITSLTLGSSVTIPSGMKIALANGQIATVNGAVSGSASVTISSLTASSAIANGSAVSFGIPFTIAVNSSVGGQTTITFKRTDTNDTLTCTDSSSPDAGGYVHIGKTGTVSSSTLAVSYANVSA